MSEKVQTGGFCAVVVLVICGCLYVIDKHDRQVAAKEKQMASEFAAIATAGETFTYCGVTMYVTRINGGGMWAVRVDERGILHDRWFDERDLPALRRENSRKETGP